MSRRAVAALGLGVALAAPAGAAAAGSVTLQAPAQPVTLRVAPTTTIAVRVTNTGTGTLTVPVRAVLPPGWSLIAPSTELTLEPGETTADLLTVAPPQGTRGGAYVIRYMVGDGDGDGTASADVHVTVPENRRLEVALERLPHARAGEVFEGWVVVRNRGNMPEEVRLETSHTEGMRFTFEPPTVRVDPGRSARVRMSASVPADTTLSVVNLRVTGAAASGVASSTGDPILILRRRLSTPERSHTLNGTFAYGVTLGDKGQALTPTVTLTGRVLDHLPGVATLKLGGNGGTLGYTTPDLTVAAGTGVSLLTMAWIPTFNVTGASLTARVTGPFSVKAIAGLDPKGNHFASGLSGTYHLPTANLTAGAAVRGGHVALAAGATATPLAGLSVAGSGAVDVTAGAVTSEVTAGYAGPPVSVKAAWRHVQEGFLGAKVTQDDVKGQLNVAFGSAHGVTVGGAWASDEKGTRTAATAAYAASLTPDRKLDVGGAWTSDPKTERFGVTARFGDSLAQNRKIGATASWSTTNGAVSFGGAASYVTPELALGGKYEQSDRPTGTARAVAASGTWRGVAGSAAWVHHDGAKPQSVVTASATWRREVMSVALQPTVGARHDLLGDRFALQGDISATTTMHGLTVGAALGTNDLLSGLNGLKGSVTAGTTLRNAGLRATLGTPDLGRGVWTAGVAGTWKTETGAAVTADLGVAFGRTSPKVTAAIRTSLPLQFATDRRSSVGRVEGRLARHDGTGIAGVKIRVGLLYAVTGTDGRFVLPDVPQGNATVEALPGTLEAGLYLDPPLPLTVNVEGGVTTTLDVTGMIAGRVAGSVRVATPAPPPDAKQQLIVSPVPPLGELTALLEGHGRVTPAAVRPDGTFALDALRPGRYRVRYAWASEGAGGNVTLDAPGEVDVRPGEVTNVNVTIRPNVRLITVEEGGDL